MQDDLYFSMKLMELSRSFKDQMGSWTMIFHLHCGRSACMCSSIPDAARKISHRS